MRIEFYLLIGGVLLSSLSQILLKTSADRAEATSGETVTSGLLSRIKSQYFNAFVIIGYLLLLGSMLIVLFAFRVVDLKYAAIIEALGYAFIMALSRVFLKEKITARKIVGNVIIICGVIIFGANITGIIVI
jgi:drug/metabolite transporter (DMT)-like permease